VIREAMFLYWFAYFSKTSKKNDVKSLYAKSGSHRLKWTPRSATLSVVSCRSSELQVCNTFNSDAVINARARHACSLYTRIQKVSDTEISSSLNDAANCRAQETLTMLPSAWLRNIAWCRPGGQCSRAIAPTRESHLSARMLHLVSSRWVAARWLTEAFDPLDPCMGRHDALVSGMFGVCHLMLSRLHKAKL
jgi:hypothetical protein